MKGRVFDLVIACMMAVFAIDMTAEKLHAGLQNQNEYDEIDALIAKSNKGMAMAGVSVQKAAEKQTEMEEEIVENVEGLHKTADSLQVAVEAATEEVAIMEEVAEEVAYTMAYSGMDTISASPMDVKEMIRLKKEIKIIDMKIEKALAGDSSANIDELILLKNMYNLNGIK